MDVIPTAVIFVSRGIVQYANPAALRMFAVRQAGELTGRRLRQWVAPSSRPRFQHLLRQAVRPSYSPVPQEIQIVAADRQVSTVEVTVSRAELPDGSMTQVVLSRLSDPARAEVQAQLSEERFRQLAENISEVFWMTDPEKKEMIYISPAYEEIFGRDCQSLYESPQDWIEAIHPEDREWVRKAALTQQVPGMYHEEYRVVRPDQSIRWIRDRAFPIHGPTGEVYRLAGIAEDITELKLVEAALRDAERFARSTLDALSSEIAILDENGMIIATNRAWNEFARANEFPYGQAAVGWNYLEVCRESTRNGLRQAAEVEQGILRVIRGEQNQFAMEYSCHSPEEKHWFIGRVTRFAGGGPVRVVVAHEEISERKQAEIALQRSERNLADFFENAVIGLHWVGPDGIILRANRAELEMLGYKREEYIGHHISEFHVDQAAVEDLLQRLANHEILNNYEARLRAKDGSIHYVLISSNVLWENGEFVHTRCFTRDITDRKFLEHQVLKISEREQQRIGQDLHDELCQHLTGIKYKISLLARKLESQFADEARDAKAVAQLLDRAIDQAYSVARGLNPVKIQSAGLQSALEELAANMESVFPVACSFGISGEPANVEEGAVAIHLYRIAQEATTNAIKHGKAAHVEIRLKAGPPGEGVTLTVEDDGIGIPWEGPPRSGMGFYSMNYRARMIGAVLEIQRASDAGGTRVKCVLPRLHG